MGARGCCAHRVGPQKVQLGSTRRTDVLFCTRCKRVEEAAFVVPAQQNLQPQVHSRYHTASGMACGRQHTTNSQPLMRVAKGIEESGLASSSSTPDSAARNPTVAAADGAGRRKVSAE
jgi:hypothetical protein